MSQGQHLHYLSSGASEPDSQSDSDWLEIASSRESDDSDSVPDDHDEVHSVPLSRRSSVSFGSSGEGDIEAWEGFVDDSGDEKSAPVVPGRYPVPPAESGTQEGLGFGMSAADNQETAEDERVKEGLEQSLISTLSASRSSSAAQSTSTHASLRDLRLSFPDPLTRSNDDLPLSRPASPPPDELADELSSIPPSTELSDTVEVTASKHEPEPGTVISTPEVSQPGKKRGIDVDIVLYGFSPVSKWTLIEELLRKAASFTHRTLQSTMLSADVAHFFFEPQSETLQANGIAVHDCTQGSSIRYASSNPDRPSLAVVFLPSDSLRVLPEHTFYLPIIVNDEYTNAVDDGTSLRVSAERAWATLSVPTGKTLRLGNLSILTSTELGNVNSFRVHRALQRLVLPTKKQTIKTLSDHLSSVPAVTFFAFLSIIMSFAINTFFRPPNPTPVSIVRVSTTPWATTNAQFNNSVATQPTVAPQQGNALIVSSLKDFALAIINPTSTALTVVSQSSACSASLLASTKPMLRKEIHSLTHADEAPPLTDIILRPATTLSYIPIKPTVGTPFIKEKESRAPSSSAISIRIPGSVSEMFETTVEAAFSMVHSDLKELIDAVDDLMRAIHAQTEKATAKSTRTVRSIREHVKYRNERARGKAREIREKSEKLIQSASEQLMETTWSMKAKGEKFVMTAQEHIKGRTVIAKSKAHGLRKKVMNSEAWQAYVAGHEEWVKRIIDKEAARREYKKWVKRSQRIKGRKDRRRSGKGHVYPI